MIPVHRFVDMKNETMKKTYETNGDFGLWELLSFDGKMMVTVEYMAGRLDEILNKIVDTNMQAVSNMNTISGAREPDKLDEVIDEIEKENVDKSNTEAEDTQESSTTETEPALEE